MCGRYAITLAPEAMRDLFKTMNTIFYPPRYNVAPTQPMLVIYEKHGLKLMEHMRWGLMPPWVKDPKSFSLLINARAEGMEDKPSFKGSLRYGRCVVPASGYYEWHTNADGTKQPYYITFTDGRPMALAGLRATWRGLNGEEIGTAATVTVAANADLEVVHDRMPAVLDTDDKIEAWLDIEHVGVEQAVQLMQPLPPGVLRFHPVSRRVNKADPDDAGLTEAVELTEAPPPPPAPRRKKAVGGDDGQLDLF
jgi:putative SOS response-associated peptidase YedK